VRVAPSFSVSLVPHLVQALIQTPSLDLCKGRRLCPRHHRRSSCIHEDTKQPEWSIGRRLIKPHQPANAYNAVADLGHIELLLMTRALEELAPFSLLTQDKALAALWCALGPRFKEDLQPGMRFTMRPDQRLFAGLTHEQIVHILGELEFDGSDD
jgi:hypothetical protein